MIYNLMKFQIFHKEKRYNFIKKVITCNVSYENFSISSDKFNNTKTFCEKCLLGKKFIKFSISSSNNFNNSYL